MNLGVVDSPSNSVCLVRVKPVAHQVCSRRAEGHISSLSLQLHCNSGCAASPVLIPLPVPCVIPSLALIHPEAANMCGIFGYLFSASASGQHVTTDKVLSTVLGGLKKLEYRGYDSAGGRQAWLRVVGSCTTCAQRQAHNSCI